MGPLNQEKVVTRAMPPWSPDPKYGDSPTSSPCSEGHRSIVAWVDQARKRRCEGPSRHTEFTSTDGWRLGNLDAVFDIGKEFTVKPGMPDTIETSIVPTNFKEDRWVTKAEILPGNRKVVHHVIAFIKTPEMIEQFKKGEGRARAWRQSDVLYRDGSLLKGKADAPVINDGCGAPNGGSAFKRPGAGEGGDAFGLFLAGYAPGKGIDVFPAGTAKRVPAGSMLVFQMHYSSYGGKFEGAQGDRTRLGLHFTSKPPERSLNTVGIQNHYFKLPAGDGNHQVTACYTFDATVHLTIYMPHMHMRAGGYEVPVLSRLPE